MRRPRFSEEFLNEFAEVAKEELMTAGLGQQCIAAGRVCVDLLTRCGLTVRPLSVKVCALNGILS